jgi:hypothetical protein
MPDYGYDPTNPPVRVPTGQGNACARHFCATCGQPFTPKREWQRFCRNVCRFADARKRHEAAIVRRATSEALLPLESAHPAGQCERLLEALKRGPVTNGDMLYRLRIGNHTGRISELREKGYRISVISQDRKTGLTTYALESPHA